MRRAGTDVLEAWMGRGEKGSRLVPNPNAFLVVLTTPPSDTPSCSGRLIATDFLKLPNRRLYPDYYEVIKAPIALDDIEVRFPLPLPLPPVVREGS